MQWLKNNILNKTSSAKFSRSPNHFQAIISIICTITDTPNYSLIHTLATVLRFGLSSFLNLPFNGGLQHSSLTKLAPPPVSPERVVWKITGFETPIIFRSLYERLARKEISFFGILNFTFLSFVVDDCLLKQWRWFSDVRQAISYSYHPECR